MITKETLINKEEVKDPVAMGCQSADTFQTPNADIMREIEEEEAKREREEKKNQAKNQLQVDRYEQEASAILVRAKRAIAEAETTALKARTEENNKYSAGGIDTREHKANITKIEETLEKTKSEIRRKFNNSMQDLKKKNPDGAYRSNNSYYLD